VHLPSQCEKNHEKKKTLNLDELQVWLDVALKNIIFYSYLQRPVQSVSEGDLA
jgi:hypothetical protein